MGKLPVYPPTRRSVGYGLDLRCCKHPTRRNPGATELFRQYGQEWILFAGPEGNEFRS